MEVQRSLPQHRHQNQRGRSGIYQRYKSRGSWRPRGPNQPRKGIGNGHSGNCNPWHQACLCNRAQHIGSRNAEHGAAQDRKRRLLFEESLLRRQMRRSPAAITGFTAGDLFSSGCSSAWTRFSSSSTRVESNSKVPGDSFISHPIGHQIGAIRSIARRGLRCMALRSTAAAASPAPTE